MPEEENPFGDPFCEGQDLSIAEVVANSDIKLDIVVWNNVDAFASALWVPSVVQHGVFHFTDVKKHGVDFNGCEKWLIHLPITAPRRSFMNPL